MVSTYTTYNMINRDYKASLDRIQQTDTVSREDQYYKDNIGKVKSVDDLLGNYRLYSYAMKAYGLEDMTYAKAFMKKVLESDLTDSKSFANTLTDSKYRDFASAFHFKADTPAIETKSQLDDVVSHYKQTIQDESDAVDADNKYFKDNIGSVKTADDLLNNEQLRTYALKAFGLDSPYWDHDTLKKVLTSDLNDPNSYVNTMNVGNKADYQAFARAFNFNSTGGLDSGVTAQTQDQTDAVVETYTFTVPTRVVPAAAEMNKTYYEKTIGSITNVDDLVNDSRMLDYIKNAYGLQDVPLKSTIKNILTSDLSDPKNYATSFGGAAFEKLTKAFNFQPDGTIKSGQPAQTAANVATTSALYMQNYDDKQDKSDQDLYDFYTKNITGMHSIDDLKGTSKLYDFVLTAFGFDPTTTSEKTIATALESDISDPKSFINTQKDPNLKAMAEDFNFDAKGKEAAPILAQSESTIQQVAKDYVIEKTRYGNDKEKDAATKEASYYSEQMQSIKTVSDFLKDKRLVNFVLESKGIDPKTVAPDFMKKLFASDLSDPKSFANTQTDHRYADIVGSFNFDTKGNIARQDTGIQGHYGQMQTEYKYLQQSLEEQVGEDSEGARLAMYFKRMAPDMNTAYDILGDSALSQVFRTAFSLPNEVASMDITKQKDLVDKNLKLADLQDPDKLDAFLNRFMAMYDLNNDTSGSSSSVLSLFNGSSANISADTLFSIASLKN
jgi:hypothetical protein